MSTEDDRPTVPDRPRTSVELPLPPPRAKALADVLDRYAEASAAVKEALARHAEDNGAAYTLARERKQAVYTQVLGVVDGALAYIGVHAQ